MTNNRTSKHKKRTSLSVPQESIQKKIFLLRGQKVMLDSDLAELYGVETRILNQSVKRNLQRFPADFIFQITKQERIELITICDNPVSLKFSPVNPYAFTEQGVTMLSCVLNSPRAVQVNIQIVRAFTKLREMLCDHKELKEKSDFILTKNNKKTGKKL